MFPKRREFRHTKRRFTEKYKVKKTNTERYRNSAVPYMQTLLNENYRKNHIEFEF
jgi:hypothetical protein